MVCQLRSRYNIYIFTVENVWNSGGHKNMGKAKTQRYVVKQGGQDGRWGDGKKENLLGPMRPTTRRSGFFFLKYIHIFFEIQRLA